MSTENKHRDLQVRNLLDTQIDWQKLLAGNGAAAVVLSIIELLSINPTVKDWEVNGAWTAFTFLFGMAALLLAILWYHVLDGVQYIKNYLKNSHDEIEPSEFS